MYFHYQTELKSTEESSHSLDVNVCGLLLGQSCLLLCLQIVGGRNCFCFCLSFMEVKVIFLFPTDTCVSAVFSILVIRPVKCYIFQNCVVLCTSGPLQFLHWKTIIKMTRVYPRQYHATLQHKSTSTREFITVTSHYTEISKCVCVCVPAVKPAVWKAPSLSDRKGSLWDDGHVDQIHCTHPLHRSNKKPGVCRTCRLSTHISNVNVNLVTLYI